MYAHHAKRVLYLAHPRTASKATAQALVRLGFSDSRHHHGRIHEARFFLGIVPDDSWTVITTTRHHADTLVSWWYEDGQTGQQITTTWLEDWAHRSPHYTHNRLFYHADHATWLWRYGDLDTDWRDFCRQFGFPHRELPQVNVSRLRAGRHWEHYFDHKALGWIRDTFGAEMAVLGYEV